ncbi:MAG: signal peptidase II [Bdellovibrionales bacterium]|nr:signal peptidase II [Bdellovibrionales bacterium]
MKSFFQHIITFFVILFMSYLLRSFFAQNTEMNIANSLIGVRVLTNASFIFGLFKDSSYLVRIVFTSVTLGIISLIFCYFYTFLSKELKLLRWAMTLMIAGFFGNALEKLFSGFVIDYAFINFSIFQNYFFNLNDVVQILGFVIAVKEIFTKQDIIWFPNVRRQQLFVYKDVQLSVLARVLGLVLIGNLTQFILGITLLLPHLKEGSEKIQALYIFCFFIINLFLLPIIGFSLIKELLKCVGPMFALERHLNDLEKDGKPLQLRKTDYFVTLETAFNDFILRNFNK